MKNNKKSIMFRTGRSTPISIGIVRLVRVCEYVRVSLMLCSLHCGAGARKKWHTWNRTQRNRIRLYDAQLCSISCSILHDSHVGTKKNEIMSIAIPPTTFNCNYALHPSRAKFQFYTNIEIDLES